MEFAPPPREPYSLVGWNLESYRRPFRHAARGTREPRRTTAWADWACWWGETEGHSPPPVLPWGSSEI